MVSTPLVATMANALETRQKNKLPIFDLHQPSPLTGPDLFSNDYLSLTTDPIAREIFLKKLAELPNVFGSAGSRLLTGNTEAHVAFETRMKEFFGAPSALLCNSGYDANNAFWHSVPQGGDVVVIDELVHASTRDGLAQSRAKDTLYLFSHNSVSSLRDCIERALTEHPAIRAGKATLFVAVESVYSMDGDFAPLTDIVRVTEELVPHGCSHIMVDEAHSTGIYGPQGKGLVVALGLDQHIDTVLHTFGKGRASAGAVLLCDPVVRKFVINYGRPIIYSTSLPPFAVANIDASFDYIGGPNGDELRASLQRIAEYFQNALESAFKDIPSNILSLRRRPVPTDFDASVAPTIFPIMTSHPMDLAAYLRRRGYAVTPIPYPAVPRGEERVRVVVHAANKTEDIDEIVGHMCSWARSIRSEAKSTEGVKVPQLQARL